MSAEQPPKPVSKEDEKPIVMVNKVLSRQAGLKDPKPKKEVKERPRRKSVSEGGYGPETRGLVLESTFNEGKASEENESAPIMAVNDNHVEVPVTPEVIEGPAATPESIKEFKGELAAAAHEITRIMLQKRIAFLRESIGEEEDKARTNSGYKLGANLRSRINAEPTADERVSSYEAELIRHETQLRELNKEHAEPVSAPEVLAPTVSSRRVSSVIPIESKRKKRGPLSALRALLGGGIIATAPLGAAAAIDSLQHHGPAPIERTQRQGDVPIRSFIQKGEGSDAMFAKLKAQTQFVYPDIKKAPPVVKEILSKDAHVLSLAFNFVSPDGKSSRPMHTGDSPEKADSVSISDDGRKLVFHAAGGRDYTLRQETTRGKLSDPAPLKDSLMPTHSHHGKHHKVHHETNHEAHGTPPQEVHQSTSESAWTQQQPQYHVNSTHVTSSYTPAEKPVSRTTSEQMTSTPEHAPEGPARLHVNSRGTLLNPEIPTVYDSNDEQHHLVVWGKGSLGELGTAVQKDYFSKIENYGNGVLIPQADGSALLMTVDKEGNGSMTQYKGPNLRIDPDQFTFPQ
jgi:hypothetical protein